ncbi:hypothetical protein RHGRI_003542 [Rhododendron griersonianum]|uniref:CWF19-like protein 2 n=1 Tax=Rhododendron griersonianum TaxID=479676 RepID=A0AAV6L8H2_9ERIC|nr:hypothetical protein RHGRI_003542 [Rhododendron griersonianum]KAG5560278.1 hypothetical protein RHGRI_003542 [Rhododendron griersonianum]
MLSGLKFVPRDQVDKAQNEDLNDSRRERNNPVGKKERGRRKKKSYRHGSSDEDDLERIGKGSRNKKKWYSSDECSSYSSGKESQSSSDQDEKKRRNKKRAKKRYGDSSEDEARDRSKKKSRNGRKDYSAEDSSLSNSDDEQKDSRSGREDKHPKGSKTHGRKKGSQRGSEIESMGDDLTGDGRGSQSLDSSNTVRKEMGLEWMLRPKDNNEREPATTSDQLEEPQAEEIKREHPRELNPYLKNNGSGYPEVEDGKKAGVSSSVVGDGGASWRLKALKRAQEQSAREGRNLKEVVEERWGSVGQLAVSVASRKAASSRAHLHAIHNRKRGLTGEHQTVVEDHNEKIPGKNSGRESMRDVSCRRSEMKVPKLHDSLSWGKQKRQTMSSEDSGLISSALSSLNRFANDGSFMNEVTRQKDDEPGGSVGSPNRERKVESESKEAENVKAKQVAEDESSRPPSERNTRRYTTHDTSIQQRKKEDDADMHLAQKIVQNKKFSTSAQADDEYDFDDGPRRKAKKKGGTDQKLNEKTNFSTRILTQQERCKFCFENPNRPRHLVVAIANFTYLSLPHWQSVAAGHCCILTLQHESATRAVDNNVWDEIRNFKKCLIMMFAKQEKDVVFLETVMGLAQQRRHCLVECIPLPQDIAKQAPLYFKKAIDEAEDEWSQHNSKKLIDTSVKGLRGSVPKDFPYFHVEFGLNKGFVHVIDDEQQFKANFGLNVIRGMLKLPEEDIYGRRKHDSEETQKQAVSSFARDWAPFDWTKQLE